MPLGSRLQNHKVRKLIVVTSEGCAQVPSGNRLMVPKETNEAQSAVIVKYAIYA